MHTRTHRPWNTFRNRSLKILKKKKKKICNKCHCCLRFGPVDFAFLQRAWPTETYSNLVGASCPRGAGWRSFQARLQSWEDFQHSLRNSQAVEASIRGFMIVDSTSQIDTRWGNFRAQIRMPLVGWMTKHLGGEDCFRVFREEKNKINKNK